MSSASGGAIDVFDESLVREIGKYIYRVYISDRYFINFADAAAKLTANASVIYRYGKSIGDNSMTGFGAFLARQQDLGEKGIRGSFGWLGRVLPALFHLDELLDAEAREPLDRDFWFEELQVMGARSFEGSNKGFYVAAKGGHNAESHNHNDVGNFIIYADGYPVLIDVGVETYTAKTFSSRRYEIWTMQSAYHNLPTINGVMQKDGKNYKSGEISYASDDKTAVFSLDLAQAYPEEAKVESWLRTITLNRGKNVIIEDQYTLEEVTDNLQITLMSWCKPELVKDGTIELSLTPEAGHIDPVFIHFDFKKFDSEIEEITIEDERLRSSWGSRLYRILLTAKDKLLKDNFSLRIDR